MQGDSNRSSGSVYQNTISQGSPLVSILLHHSCIFDEIIKWTQEYLDTNPQSADIVIEQHKMNQKNYSFLGWAALLSVMLWAGTSDMVLTGGVVLS